MIRIAGPSGAGKTTLIMRSLAHLGQFDAVASCRRTSRRADPEGGPAQAAGVREVVEPSAHWRSGLERVVSRLADAELILVEDRDGELDLAHGIGEDVQVAVVPAADAGSLSALQLSDAQAVVLTAADGLPPERVAEIVAAVEQRCPGLATFVVASVQDDAGTRALGPVGGRSRWMRRHG